jgi:diguanylate cyclase (GGDEF)-like protein
MSEQRHAERLSLSMTVQLIARGLNRRSCRMKDISPGGALLELQNLTVEEATVLKRGDVIILRMFLGEGANTREHELRARIAHIEEALLGVSFFSPDDETLKTLLASAKSTSRSVGELPAASRTLLAQLSQQVLGFCRYRLPDFFKSAEEALFHAADNARSNTDQRMFFDAVTLVRKQQGVMKERFLVALDDILSRTDEARGRLGKRPDVSGLALVDKDQFEEWLIVKVISSRVEASCRSQLFALKARLDELIGGGDHNWFAPTDVCEAFQEAITVLRPSIPLERLLYNSFEESILSGFEGMYESLNETLIRNGVLPDLDPSHFVTKHHDEGEASAAEAEGGKESVQQAVQPAGTVAGSGASAKTVTNGEVSQPTNGSAGNGSGGMSGGGANPISAADGTATVAAAEAGSAPIQAPRSAAEFLARLGGGSAQQRFESSQRDAKAAVTALKRLFERQSAKRDEELMSVAEQAGEVLVPITRFDIADVQQNFTQLKQAGESWRPELDKIAADKGSELAGSVQSLIQMSDGLLTSLVQNQSLGELAKTWFRRLELPLLFSLMADDDLFQREDHPARQVLNRLARLGFRDHPLTKDQEKAIHQLVEDIADGFDSQPDVFDKALGTLEPMVKRQEVSYQRNLERVRQLAEGEHRLESARHRVQQVLDERLASKRVPQPVVTLVESGWKDLLIKTHLRQGEESPQWKGYTAVLDELLLIGADMHRLFDLRSILKQIKAGLQELGDTGGQQQQQAVSELKRLLSGPQRMLEDVQWVQMPTAQVEEKGDPAEERWLEKWMDRARRLQLGDWIELRHRGEGGDRMRLAWRAEDESRFVFVNHQGVKVSDFTLRELAALMHTGNALIFEGDDIPVVDDALERVVHQLYDQLAWNAMHDELTGLTNRAEFTRQLQRVVDDAKRKRSRHVVGYINLDQFKLVNSASGFAAGDQLLKDVAHLLNKALKAKTLVSRLNADEFGLLLEDCDLGKAQQLVSLRLGELAAMKFTWSSQDYKLTASAGLVDITYASENDATILRAAEEACAQAKKDGGNRIQIYQPDADELNRRDNVMVWVAKLNQALEQERLTLRCQKIQSIVPGQMEEELPHYEILLGMRDDGGEDLPPSEFIQAAERYNRMLAVDRWVVDSAFHWMKESADKLDKIGMFSINLSGHSLSDAKMMSYVFDRLLEYGLPTQKICFEITETTAIGNLPDAVDLMRELKKVGCRFALDDFGAGHATFSYLKHLPVDFVKIDGAFVRDIATDENDFAMVRSINDLAHYMGLKTIAEYVENEEILSRLQEIGVDYAQGYCIERPRWLDSL